MGKSLSSVDPYLLAVVRSPGGVFVSAIKRKKEVDIDHVHFSLALSVLKATAQQHVSRY